MAPSKALTVLRTLSLETINWCECILKQTHYNQASRDEILSSKSEDLLQAVLCVIVGALQLPVQLLHLSSRLNSRRESLKKNTLKFAIYSSEDQYYINLS